MPASAHRGSVERYHTALGALREVLACLEVTEALAPAIEPALVRRFNHCIGTLVRLVQAR